ncbi:M48 family metallopeptidase [Chloroflexota bacterium]
MGKRKTSFDGQTISYTIKRSPRAKYVRLEVRSGTGLTVVIPKSYRLDRLSDLLRGKSRWILDKLAKYHQGRMLSAEQGLKGGNTISYLGRDLEVVVRRDHRNESSVKLVRQRIIVSLAQGNDRLDLVLEQWYRAQAGKLMMEKADRLSTQLGVRYNRLVIRGQKTRWGSCSQMGNLSFNWKLMMAPQPVIDYVIIHELAHLKEMNHTKTFWQLVACYCPRWRQHRKWLKDHEAELASKLPL